MYQQHKERPQKLVSIKSVGLGPGMVLTFRLDTGLRKYSTFCACLEYCIDERNCSRKQELYLTADLIVFLNLNKWKHLTTMLPFALPRAT